jgi:hypothetical protein
MNVVGSSVLDRHLGADPDPDPDRHQISVADLEPGSGMNIPDNFFENFETDFCVLKIL